MLRNQLLCEPEVEDIQKKVARHIEDVEQLAKANQETKKDLLSVIAQYEDKMVEYESLKSQNQSLEQEQKEKCISKK